MLDQKPQCLSLGFTWVLWKEKGKYLQNQDRLWEKHSVLIVCESMLLSCHVRERHGTLFVTPMQDCEVLKSQLKRVKWCPFPMLHLCLSGWEMRREQSTAATVAQVFWGMKAGLTLDAARATVCFQRVDFPLCDLLLETRFLPHGHSWGNATIRCCLCARPARKARLSLSREGKQNMYKHPLLVTIKTTGWKAN